MRVFSCGSFEPEGCETAVEAGDGAPDAAGPLKAVEEEEEEDEEEAVGAGAEDCCVTLPPLIPLLDPVAIAPGPLVPRCPRTRCTASSTCSRVSAFEM
jgi:hypothetical protein